MRISQYANLTLLAFSPLSEGARNPEKILLSNVKTLTLRKDLKTSHNRVAAVPQLKCIGGNAKGLYEVDVMRCRNQGADYDEENVQWTCTASLPPEFKLGSTDVICEGFASTNDPYILKGSCGVEYRLILTEAGQDRYGRQADKVWDFDNKEGPRWPALLFWCLFVCVLGWIIYSAWDNARGGINRLGGGNNPWGGWGGGGGGGGGGSNDPPPPYDYPPPPSYNKYNPYASQEGWRPGFWTGALGGTAAGYLAGNRRNQNQTRNAGSSDYQGNNGGGILNNNNGEGSSSWGGGGRTRSYASSSTPSFSSTRHESSGFGSTSRR